MFGSIAKCLGSLKYSCTKCADHEQLCSPLAVRQIVMTLYNQFDHARLVKSPRTLNRGIGGGDKQKAQFYFRTNLQLVPCVRRISLTSL